jgi:hypothetical protein
LITLAARVIERKTRLILSFPRGSPPEILNSKPVHQKTTLKNDSAQLLARKTAPIEYRTPTSHKKTHDE